MLFLVSSLPVMSPSQPTCLPYYTCPLPSPLPHSPPTLYIATPAYPCLGSSINRKRQPWFTLSHSHSASPRLPLHLEATRYKVRGQLGRHLAIFVLGLAFAVLAWDGRGREEREEMEQGRERARPRRGRMPVRGIDGWMDG